MTDTNTARITVANQKGGAGKTTDVIHTGGALSARGHDVLLVDIDYHGGLTCSLGYNDLYYDTDRTTLFDVLDFDQMESVNDIIVEHEEFDILPASEKLANNKNIQTLLEAPKSRERLEMTLDELDKDYDYIIVDTPPSLNVLTDNALVATGNVVIPVIPEKLNANSLQIFAKQLSSSNRRTETSIGSRLSVTVSSRTPNTATPSRRSSRRTPSQCTRSRSGLTSLSQLARECPSSALARRTSASRMHATCSTRSPTCSTRRSRRLRLRRWKHDRRLGRCIRHRGQLRRGGR